MRKFSVLILAILLIAITFSFTSCDFNLDQFCDEVIASVVGEDNPFSEQMREFEPLMLSRVYGSKLIDICSQITTVFTEADFGSILGIIQFIFTLILFFVTWLLSVAAYIVGTLFFFAVDLVWLVMYAISFLLLLMIYSFDLLLTIVLGAAV